MNDLDVNILVQTFNERLASLITEVVIKEATIKQLKGEMEKMMEVVRATKQNKKQEDKKQLDNFE
jgi:hypothetical protein